ncbi:MAG: hypothetical protein AAF560_33620, partial [Acidobacteriota bacterium]
NAHETEAARLAQLLVAEIKLYNEAHIAKGSKTSRIYTMLQDDIERSRQLYAERISVQEPDFFLQQVITQLAGGDLDRLGI